jgi:hypothetical protein
MKVQKNLYINLTKLNANNEDSKLVKEARKNGEKVLNMFHDLPKKMCEDIISKLEQSKKGHIKMKPQKKKKVKLVLSPQKKKACDKCDTQLNNIIAVMQNDDKKDEELSLTGAFTSTSLE